MNGVNETYGYDSATGNLSNKAGTTLTYGDTNHKHAVTSAGGNTYSYDANGNQTTRVIGAQTYTLSYNAENQLVTVTGPSMTISFIYDGDGRQVMRTYNGGNSTHYVGPHFEKEGIKQYKFYFAGSTRIARGITGGSAVEYFLSDHLGSRTITTNSSGSLIHELRYKPWGERRETYDPAIIAYNFTGQREESTLGLYFYNARWYDPALGRMAQADSIVPPNQGVQAWDRYAYTNNNPVKYTDPTGHCIGPAQAVACINYLWNMGLHLVGALPDYGGIATTVALTDTNDATVAAGLAVQSEYPWSIFGGGGEGLAQLTSDEMEEFGLEGQDPYSSSVAVKGMEKRIQNALDDCTSCTTGYDRLIVAAIAQNGSVQGLDNFGGLPINDQNNTIDWNTFLTNPEIGSSGSSLAQLRAGINNEQYSTLFMLRLYIQDLRVLMKLGYQLPDGITEDDVKYIEDHFLNHHKDNRR